MILFLCEYTIKKKNRVESKIGRHEATRRGDQQFAVQMQRDQANIFQMHWRKGDCRDIQKKMLVEK